MPRTLIGVKFMVEHAPDVTDDELHDMMESLKFSYVRPLQEWSRSQDYIDGFRSTNPDGIIDVEPDEIWVQGTAY